MKNRGPWRCFHCGELLQTEFRAREHFGDMMLAEPACTIDIAEYRRMEAVHRRHCEEDTDLHRALYAKDSELRLAVRRAEEEGYARGLADARKHPEELGLTRPAA